MSTITLDVTGLPDVMLHLRSMPGAIRLGIERAVFAQALRLQTIIKDEVLPGLPIKQGDSYQKLRNSIHIETESSADAVTAKVGTQGVIKSSKYGEFNIAAGLEYGTVAHVIEARLAPRLTFMVGGRWVSKKAVNHPGTKAYHPITGTLEREAPAIRAALEGAVQQAVKP